MIFVVGITWKFQKFCMKTFPCTKKLKLSFTYPQPKVNPIEHLGGMIRLGGNQKHMVGLAP